MHTWVLMGNCFPNPASSFDPVVVVPLMTSKYPTVREELMLVLSLPEWNDRVVGSFEVLPLLHN